MRTSCETVMCAKSCSTRFGLLAATCAVSFGGLDVCTPRFNGNSQGIVWVDVQGSQTSNTVNRNKVEARKAVAIAMQYASEFTTATIGIVTPFKAQAERINTLIPIKTKVSAKRVAASSARTLESTIRVRICVDIAMQILVMSW